MSAHIGGVSKGLNSLNGLSRREFLTAMGGMVVSFAVPTAGASVGALASTGTGPWPEKVATDALDSWLVVGADGRVTAAVGKIDAGMGIGTSFAQIIAEELDVPMAAVTIHMGDTATTPDQRGTGSSNGIIDGGSALRNATRASAPALRSALPPSIMPFDEPVPRWSGVVAVSPI